LPPPPPPRDRWQVTLQAEGAGPPVYVRLKRCLKNMLRSFGIRAVDIRQIKEKSDDQKGPQ
jgi:hypothetical protein